MSQTNPIISQDVGRELYDALLLLLADPGEDRIASWKWEAARKAVLEVDEHAPIGVDSGAIGRAGSGR
jgi:hypothetical protein